MDDSTRSAEAIGAAALRDWADDMERAWEQEPPNGAIWGRIVHALVKPTMTVVVKATRGRAALVERGER